MQPPETMHEALTIAGYDTGLDAKKLIYINDFFKPIKKEVIASGLLDPLLLTPQPEGLINQVPGGMLSNTWSHNLKRKTVLIN